jgi:cystathionine beta-lyase
VATKRRIFLPYRHLPSAGIIPFDIPFDVPQLVKKAMTPDVRLVIIESPTNPRLQITDIVSVVALAKAVGAIVCVDNSIMAMFQQPLVRTAYRTLYRTPYLSGITS